MKASCTRCQSIVEPEDVRCAVCGLPTPAPDLPRIDEVAARILRCHGCAAAVSYDPEVKAPRCDFCRATMAVETPLDPIGSPEYFVDFAVKRKEAAAALRTWLGSRSIFCPGDLQSAARVTRLRPLWWVGWRFDANVVVHWAADSNADSRRSSWAPHAGRCVLDLQRVVVPGSRGLSTDECLELIPRYDLSAPSPRPRGPAKAVVERFTIQRSAARRRISSALRAVALRRTKPQVPGTRHRNLHISVLPTRLESQRYAFPAYVLAYRYRGAVHRAVVHGQDASCVVGTVPYSWVRVALAIGLGFLGVVLVLVLLASISR